MSALFTGVYIDRFSTDCLELQDLVDFIALLKLVRIFWHNFNQIAEHNCLTDYR